MKLSVFLAVFLKFKYKKLALASVNGFFVIPASAPLFETQTRRGLPADSCLAIIHFAHPVPPRNCP